jgi:glutaredoxin
MFSMNRAQATMSGSRSVVRRMKKYLRAAGSRQPFSSDFYALTPRGASSELDAMSIRDRAKAKLQQALTSPAGSGFLPIRFARRAANLANDLLGDPVGASAAKAPVAPEPPPPAPRPPAPVFLYVEWDSPGRAQIEALLRERGIPHKVLEIDHDAPMKEFVARTPTGGAPVLFIGGDPIGGLAEIEALPEAELRERVFGPQARGR